MSRKHTPRLLGWTEALALMGAGLIATGLAWERPSLCLLWLGSVLLFITWGTIRTNDDEETP